MLDKEGYDSMKVFLHEAMFEVAYVCTQLHILLADFPRFIFRICTQQLTQQHT